MGRLSAYGTRGTTLHQRCADVLHGDVDRDILQAKRGRHVTVADRLDDVLEIRKRLNQASWKECFVIVTNPFEGNAVDSLPRIAAALGDEGLAQRLRRPPGQVLFPDAPSDASARRSR